MHCRENPRQFALPCQQGTANDYEEASVYLTTADAWARCRFESTLQGPIQPTTIAFLDVEFANHTKTMEVVGHKLSMHLGMKRA